VIVFAMNTFGPLARIPASGGEPSVVTKLEGQQTAHLYPLFLPDGSHFLFFSRATPGEQGIYMASLDSSAPKMLVPADEGPVGYLPSGWLFYMRQQLLRAQRLDVQKLELSGDVVAVASSVADSLSVSSTGLIGYRAASARRTQLVWTDRTGKTLGMFGPQSDTVLSAPTLSPDERRVAMWRNSNEDNPDVVLVDATRVTRFTFESTVERYPIWSPDGRTIVFDSTRNKSRDLYRSANSGGEERLLATPQPKTANDWSPDGRFILFQSNDPKTGIDLWVLPLEGKREPFVFLRTPFNERRATFSPDGRWIAYLSNESGQYEVYVRQFSDPGRSWKISSNGGIQPCWSADGKELYYIGPDSTLMAVAIKVTGSLLDPAAPVALFSRDIVGSDSVDSGLQFDVARDGRFLLNTISTDTSPITVIVNWSPEIPN
jgi:Tol biopolymer transport system component